VRPNQYSPRVRSDLISQRRALGCRSAWCLAFSILLAGSLILVYPSVWFGEEPSSTPKRILLLYHVGRKSPGVTLFDRGFEAVLRSAPPSTIELYREVLENYRFPGENHKQMMRNYLKEKYAGRRLTWWWRTPIPLSISFCNIRNEFFPGVPLVYVINKRPEPGKEPGLRARGFGPGHA